MLAKRLIMCACDEQYGHGECWQYIPQTFLRTRAAHAQTGGKRCRRICAALGDVLRVVGEQCKHGLCKPFGNELLSTNLFNVVGKIIVSFLAVLTLCRIDNASSTTLIITLPSYS